MKPIHTPGPWRVLHAQLKPGGINYIGVGTKTFGVCSVEWATERTQDAVTQIANARLIAAAPDLLAALQRWEQYARDNAYSDEDCTFLTATRAALSKATGDA